MSPEHTHGTRLLPSPLIRITVITMCSTACAPRLDRRSLITKSNLGARSSKPFWLFLTIALSVFLASSCGEPSSIESQFKEAVWSNLTSEQRTCVKKRWLDWGIDGIEKNFSERATPDLHIKSHSNDPFTNLVRLCTSEILLSNWRNVYSRQTAWVQACLATMTRVDRPGDINFAQITTHCIYTCWNQDFVANSKMTMCGTTDARARELDGRSTEPVSLPCDWRCQEQRRQDDSGCELPGECGYSDTNEDFGNSDTSCIGDCTDMDNDGLTWNDYDADGDGLYESNP
jgi:hypothetical protein